MRAITVVPGRKGSIAVVDIDEPDPAYGSILVDGVALGICGTDTEIADGQYGEAPGGFERLVLGHESLGRVREAPAGSGLSAGDLVVGIVRRPDPVPCACCGRGEWDMCRNGAYTERGIKGLHGYGAQRWRIEPEFAVGVDRRLGLTGVLMEPTSIVAKAWTHIDAIASRACTDSRTVLVTGAGPIGLLAAMMGIQRGHEVHVLDHHEDGPKPRLVEALGATYHYEGMSKAPEADVLIEATGVPKLVLEAMEHARPDGVVCLTGVSPVGDELVVDIGRLGRRIVLGNQVVFGTVNANRDHYRQAADALAAADREWLDGIITRRVPLERAPEALRREPDDIKVVVDLSTA
ncbi:MAG: glucose 1-dehydrogenase [Solirubrobacterales bacterium]|nr:glucose 1-dehydrogenase [Solirubrobacterales bacterium]